MKAVLAACLALVAAASAVRAEEGTVRLHAAGSLRPALTEIMRAFTAAHGIRVEAAFGASGLLRERLVAGEPGGVHASADMAPLALARDGKAGPVVLFARNRLCAIARPGRQAVDLPPELAVGAEHGLTVLRAADPGTALPLAMHVLSPDGQAILARHGFDAPLAPR